jgi:peptidoglycan hydrolase-like protein with peptidoglycan-binding domain
MDSERVLMVKSRLYQKKYYTGKLDTKFDLQLHVAVTAFQHDNNLKDDGIVGSMTWFKIFGYKMTGNALVDQLFDPERNIDYAAQYLAYLIETLKTRDYELLAAAYNAGEVGKSVNYITRVRRNVAKQTAGLANAPRFD